MPKDDWVHPLSLYAESNTNERHARQNWQHFHGVQHPPPNRKLRYLSLMSDLPDDYIKEQKAHQRQQMRRGIGMEPRPPPGPPIQCDAKQDSRTPNVVLPQLKIPAPPQPPPVGCRGARGKYGGGEHRGMFTSRPYRPTNSWEGPTILGDSQKLTHWAPISARNAQRSQLQNEPPPISRESKRGSIAYSREGWSVGEGMGFGPIR